MPVAEIISARRIRRYIILHLQKKVNDLHWPFCRVKILLHAFRFLWEVIMNAVKIVMRENAYSSNNPKDIVEIFIENESGDVISFGITQLYDYLSEYSDKRIHVKNSSSYLIPVRAFNGQKYIRSIPNASILDELMKLPRC